jgi:hypothetical protein
MLKKEKSELLVRLENTVLIIVGIVMVAGMLALYRGGMDWFTNIQWAKISVLKWVALGGIVLVTLVFQYYLLLLLRYSLLKHLFWFLPVLWLVNNGLIVIERFIQGEYHQAIGGYIPLTDLFGWLISLVYFPLLIGGGAISAIADSGGFVMTQACSYAHAVFEAARVSNGSVVSFIGHHVGAFWDILTDSFKKQVAWDYAGSRPFIDITQNGLFRMPNWMLNLGYTFSCIAL